jgi:hypothetical protein
MPCTPRPSRALLWLLLIACEQSGRSTATEATEPASVIRDSAGIQIVVSARPQWGEQPAWVLADSPRVVIGVEEGDAPYLLDDVAAAVRMSDGRIALLESGTSELRFYDANGTYLSTVARKGSGPGELRAPEHLLRLPGDTLAVWTWGLGPVSYFAPDGTFLRREPIDRTRVMSLITMDRATEALTPLADGSFVLHVQWLERMRVRPPPGVVYRPAIGFFRFPRDLSRMDSLGWYDGGLPQLYLEIGGRRVHETMPIPPHVRLAAGTDPIRIFIGDGAAWDIYVYDAAGRVTRIMRRTDAPDTLPVAEVKRIQQIKLSAGNRFQSRADIQRVHDAMPRQTHYPAYSSLRLDSEGYLWARSTRGQQVFDSAGHWLGTLPLRDTPLDIGRDYVLTLGRDSSGVERVRLFDLRR